MLSVMVLDLTVPGHFSHSRFHKFQSQSSQRRLQRGKKQHWAGVMQHGIHLWRRSLFWEKCTQVLFLTSKNKRVFVPK